MSDTTTGGKASFDEMKRLREAATQGEWTALGCAVSGPFSPKGHAKQAIVVDSRIGMQQARDTATFIAYAANHAVTLLESERAHSDKLAEALAFVLNAPHPPRLPSGACICVRHEDAGKLVDEHAKLRGAQ